MPQKRKSGDGVRNAEVPSFAKGRKGGVSIIDCMVRALWMPDTGAHGKWPAKTFPDLAKEVSVLVGYRVSQSTIRSSAYAHPELFVRDTQEGILRWRLTATARQA